MWASALVEVNRVQFELHEASENITGNSFYWDLSPAGDKQTNKTPFTSITFEMWVKNPNYTYE